MRGGGLVEEKRGAVEFLTIWAKPTIFILMDVCDDNYCIYAQVI